MQNMCIHEPHRASTQLYELKNLKTKTKKLIHVENTLPWKTILLQCIQNQIHNAYKTKTISTVYKKTIPGFCT